MEPVPPAAVQSLSTASDEAVSAMPDRVAFRDGPGTWAKNADWDEYWVSIENMSNGERSLLLFFPLSPSPRQLEITYVAGGNKRLLVVDTLAALDGLHSGTQ
jgi:hypothetical protein